MPLISGFLSVLQLHARLVRDPLALFHGKCTRSPSSYSLNVRSSLRATPTRDVGGVSIRLENLTSTTSTPMIPSSDSSGSSLKV